jgi:hypothetical protein
LVLHTRKDAVRNSIEVDVKTHKKLKLHALITGKSMKEIIAELVSKNLDHNHECCTPNAETIQALEEGKRGEGLVEYKGVEEFFNWLRNV